MRRFNILDWLVEYWLPVKGYEGLYEVSNWGRIRSLERTITLIDKGTETKRIQPESILKPCLHKYLRVTLCKNGKKHYYLIHRLVAEAFIPNPNGLLQVNHKDENKFNNCVWNLEWCDAKYNCNYGSRNNSILETRANKAHKNAEKPVLQYTKDGQLVEQYRSAKIAGHITKINDKNINAVCLGKRHTAGGFIWKYLNT